MFGRDAQRLALRERAAVCRSQCGAQLAETKLERMAIRTERGDALVLVRQAIAGFRELRRQLRDALVPLAELQQLGAQRRDLGVAFRQQLVALAEHRLGDAAVTLEPMQLLELAFGRRLPLLAFRKRLGRRAFGPRQVGADRCKFARGRLERDGALAEMALELSALLGQRIAREPEFASKAGGLRKLFLELVQPASALRQFLLLAAERRDVLPEPGFEARDARHCIIVTGRQRQEVARPVS